MDITIFDALLVAMILVSSTLAMIRGFVREIISVIPWIIAAFAAYRFHHLLIPPIEQYIGNSLVAIVIAISATAFTILLITGLITRKLCQMILDSRVGALDRSVGFIFGAARGFLLMVFLTLMFNWLVSEPLQPPWITDSRSKSILDSFGQELIDFLPESPTASLIDNNRRVISRQSDSEIPTNQEDDNSYSENDRNRLNQLSTGANN